MLFQRLQNVLIQRLSFKHFFVFFLIFIGKRNTLTFIVGNLRFVVNARKRAFHQHLFDTLFRDSITALKRLHNGVFFIKKLRVIVNLAKVARHKIGIKVRDSLPVLSRNFILLVADGFTQFMVNLGGVDELYFAFAFFALVFRENPNVSLNARVVEQIGRQSDNRFNKVTFQKPTANLTFARSGIAVKQRRAVFDNRRSAAKVVHFVHGGLQENHLRVATARKSVSPSARFAFGVFVAHGLLLSVLCVFTRPRCAERRVFDDETHFRIGKAIGFERIDVTEIIRVLIFNEHFSKPYRVRLPHKFLPEQFDFRRRIIVFYVGIRRGKHTARSAGLVENGNNLVAVENIVATFRH